MKTNLINLLSNFIDFIQKKKKKKKKNKCIRLEDILSFLIKKCNYLQDIGREKRSKYLKVKTLEVK
jgi:hypothetical protein